MLIFKYYTMKFRYNYPHSSILVLILMVLVSFSCSKSFLDINPKGKLIAQSVSDYDLLLNSNNLLNTGGANAHVFLSDDIAAAEPYFSSTEPRTTRLFKWEPLIYEAEENAPETESLLQQLYTYNKIINEIVDASGGTEQQKKSVRAEALAGRAWVYFMLVNYFAKPFNAETAATDPGFPIVKDADVTATTFTRPSVKDVYDFIVDDLSTAIPDLPVQITYRLRMSKPAAEALLGKVYMFMGKFNEALPLLTSALDNVQQAAIPLDLIDYNEAFAPDGEFMPIDDFFGPSTPVIGEDRQTLYARQFSNFWITSSEIVISPQTVSLFEASDQRLNFYSDMPFPAGPSYQNGLLRRMGPLTTSYGVVLPDIVLLRAECRARLNDLDGCVNDLENLRSKRLPATDADVPPSIINDQQLLLEYVLEERTREFASQGVRWFDMRRLSVDPIFPSIESKHSIYNEDGSSQEFSLPANRLVMKIPAKILGENPGMEDNP